MKIEICISEIQNLPNFNKLSTLNFVANFGQGGGKYLIKIILDMKIEISIYEKYQQGWKN